jgi:hypothetical protein
MMHMSPCSEQERQTVAPLCARLPLPATCGGGNFSTSSSFTWIRSGVFSFSPDRPRGAALRGRCKRSHCASFAGSGETIRCGTSCSGGGSPLAPGSAQRTRARAFILRLRSTLGLPARCAGCCARRLWRSSAIGGAKRWSVLSGGRAHHASWTWRQRVA